MKVSLTMLASFLVSGSAFAALPPFYQTAREMKEVLSNQDVAAKLGVGNQITSIYRVEHGYIVSTSQCALPVTVNYLPSTVPGPALFELVVGEANCETH